MLNMQNKSGRYGGNRHVSRDPHHFWRHGGTGFTGSGRGGGGHRGNRRSVNFSNRNEATTADLRRNLSLNIRNRKQKGNRHDDPDSHWFRVNIPHGVKYSKDFIFTSLNSMVDKQFIPFNYHTEGNTVIFYVQGTDTSDMLKSCNKRITTPNGYKMSIFVNQSALPQTPLDSTTISQIRESMSKRYNSDLKILDLSQFNNDPHLTGLGLYISLGRTNMFNCVVRTIKEYIPDVVHLSLYDNKLQNLEPLRSLSETCKALKEVNLGKNRITNITELDFMKGLNIEELILEKNPVSSSFKEPSAYISSMRSRFPKLIKLDGEALPAPIGFDTEEKIALPTPSGSYIPEETKDFILTFLRQFYTLYDSDDRQPLLDAYHDHACFSYSISRTDLKSQTFSQNMIQESRNLMRVKDSSLSNELLKQGKVNIVSSLCKLPKTIHESDSFTIDVYVCHAGLINVVINGVYREIVKKQSVQLRAFSRTMMIVPNLIINDMLLLTNATVEQIQKYNSKPSTTSLSTGSTHEEVMDPGIQQDIKLTNPQAYMEKANLVKRFSSETNMNTSYSLQCLEEHKYDYGTAMNVFKELNGRGLIPSDAFQ